jgi:hypothetical protein
MGGPVAASLRVTRNTAKRLAERLGVDETQVIHLALHEMAVTRERRIAASAQAHRR